MLFYFLNWFSTKTKRTTLLTHQRLSTDGHSVLELGVLLVGNSDVAARPVSIFHSLSAFQRGNACFSDLRFHRVVLFPKFGADY